MTRTRKPENRGLPARWRFVRNAYYYQVPPGLESRWDDKQTFRLGKTLPEAYAAWAARLGTLDRVTTIAELLDRYALEVIPTRKPATARRYRQHLPFLRAVFGAMALDSLRPQDVYRYIDRRSRKIAGPAGRDIGGATTARHEIALLSHAYTKAVEWGYLDRHPFKSEVRVTAPKPRTRYIEDWEIIACLTLPPMRKKGSVRMIQGYIKLKLLTGLRAGDMLRLQEKDIRDDGIHVTTGKTGKPVIYEWTPDLRAAITEIRAARPIRIAPLLFCTKKGKGYVNETTGDCTGWHSMWQRFMDRVLAETAVTERFTEHDLRAKCASDAETLERARQMLTHADSRTTNRIYRRKPERIQPAK